MNTQNHSHTTQAIAVHCMDFRLQKHLNDWLPKQIPGGYDRVAVAGSIKDMDFVLGQIGLSAKLHMTKEVYLINHEDCGGYGAEGTYERLTGDLKKMKEKVKTAYPQLQVHLIYETLAGEFEEL